MQTKKPEVAIIGAGITGLTTALRLAQNGVQVTLLEKSSALGGLASGFPLLGTNLEVAYHHLFRTDSHIIQLLEELGLGHKLVWRPSSVAVIDHSQVYPFGGALDLLRFQPLAFRDRLRLGAVILALQRRKDWRSLVNITAADWMRRACGERVFKTLWEPLLVGKFHQFASQVSMAWLWARIHTRAKSRSNIGGREQLGYIQGGFAVLVEALRKRLVEFGVHIITGTSVESIRTEDGGMVTVTWANTSKSFNAVLSTLPSRIFCELILRDSHASLPYQNQLQSMLYLGALCVVFTSRQSLSNYYWHNIHDVKAPFLVFLQHTNFVPVSWYQGQHVYYLGTYVPHEHTLFTSNPEDIEHRFFQYLQRVFPAFDRSQVSMVRVTRLPYAQHVVTTGYVGMRPNFQTPLPKVYLSNFSQIFPEDRGTNFAVRAGEEAAQRMLRDL